MVGTASLRLRFRDLCRLITTPYKTLFPEPLEAASQGPHIDPPAHPYEPFDWAAERLSGAQDRLSEHLSRLYADTE
jgi:hypothetical protein